MFVADRPLMSSHEKEGQVLDLLVGLVSYANHSALSKSGLGCTMVSSIQPWIQNIIYHKVHMRNHTNVSKCRS